MKKNSLPDQELDALLSGFFDGVLDEKEEARLQERLKKEPEARKQYLHYSELDGSLTWDYATAAAEQEETIVPMEQNRPGRQWRFPIAVAAIAAAAIAMVGFFLFFGGLGDHPVLTVEFADGAEYRHGGESRALAPGDELREGTLLIESPSGAAELKFKDGTLVTLSGGSEVDFSEADDGKSLRVRSGRLTANVAPQPDGKPMRILTPTAEVEVLGTILNLDTVAHSTGLSVEEGRVRLRRLTDGQAVEVPAHHRTLATLHSSHELTVQKSHDPLAEWEIHPREVTKAKRMENEMGEMIYGSVPYIAGRRSDDTKVVRHGISFNGNLASLRPDSQIRIQYRSEIGPTLFLGTRKKSGHFGGNFEYDLHSDEGEIRADGWKEAVIPISQFQVVANLSHRSFELEKNILSKILVSVSENDSLEVKALSVEAVSAP